ncbi:O(6)-methylguanine-induced apoptosis 2 [Labrus mixtus]|uniref:O(6)-methylguanine-induced apoptosis 2 n=1 Tax=Labrus mixtus TaxID=508554 RepID=UPI0029C05C05|nr:O(6)-methylguanine-induced apoptosis 2 [Labrus mixtus]
MSTCTVSSSVPAKHQRVVIINPEKKGFSSQAKRFHPQATLTENPGPCSYDCVSSAVLSSPSFSIKGTTGFVVSKAARPSSFPVKGSPGPSAYNLQDSFVKKKDFNTGVSRVFRLPVAVKVEGPKHLTPAPNQYDVSCCSRERFSSAVGTSAFLSKTRRTTFDPNNNAPSPCQYDVNTSVIQLSPKAVSSPFRSKTQRIPAPAAKCGPGPGAYSPHKTPAPVKRTFLPRGHCLAIAAPPLIVPKDPHPPGPGHYDINDCKFLSKFPKLTAAFASGTERKLQNLKVNTTPGPGFYDPQFCSKQSFIFSDSKVWLPV